VYGGWVVVEVATVGKELEGMRENDMRGESRRTALSSPGMQHERVKGTVPKR